MRRHNKTNEFLYKQTYKCFKCRTAQSKTHWTFNNNKPWMSSHLNLSNICHFLIKISYYTVILPIKKKKEKKCRRLFLATKLKQHGTFIWSLWKLSEQTFLQQNDYRKPREKNISKQKLVLKNKKKNKSGNIFFMFMKEKWRIFKQFTRKSDYWTNKYDFENKLMVVSGWDTAHQPPNR